MPSDGSKKAIIVILIICAIFFCICSIVLPIIFYSTSQVAFYTALAFAVISCLLFIILLAQAIYMWSKNKETGLCGAEEVTTRKVEACPYVKPNPCGSCSTGSCPLRR